MIEEHCISVIVPIYNVEKYLKRCIESILNQTYKNLEIILVDDGSPDNSGKICDEYAKLDSRIKVIHKKNGGLSDARNAGIAIASGKYIGFVDSDDYIDKEMYEYLYKLLSNNNASIAICGYSKIWEDRKIIEFSGFIEKEKVLEKDEAIKTLIEDKYIQSYAWNKLYDKDLFQTVKFPINKKMEDVATTYKLFYNTSKVVVGNKSLYFYTQRDDSILGNKQSSFYLDYIEIEKEKYIFIKNIYPDMIENYFKMFNFILAIYLISDTEVEELLKDNHLKDELNEIYKILQEKKYKLSLKTKIKYFCTKQNLTLYRFIFRGYMKWCLRLKLQDVI